MEYLQFITAAKAAVSVGAIGIALVCIVVMMTPRGVEEKKRWLAFVQSGMGRAISIIMWLASPVALIVLGAIERSNGPLFAGFLVLVGVACMIPCGAYMDLAFREDEQALRNV